jgi:hypothetical protein
MCDNRELKIEKDTYYSLCAAATSLACKHWGYNFIYYIPKSEKFLEYSCFDPNNSLESRHPAWSKVIAAYDHLIKNDVDYVIYLDTDCFLTNFEKINFFNADINFGSNYPWGGNSKEKHREKPCSGFFILKKTNYALNFLETWYKANLKEYNWNHSWEQKALWNLMDSKKFNVFLEKTKTYFVDKNINDISYSNCLHHLSKNTFKKDHLEYTKKYIEKYYLLDDVKKEISNIVQHIFYTDKYTKLEKW